MKRRRLCLPGASPASVSAAGLLLTIYSAAVFVLPKNVFEHPDAGVKFLGVRALRLRTW